MANRPTCVALATATVLASGMLALGPVQADVLKRPTPRMLTWELPSMPGKLVILRAIVSLPLPFIAAWVTQVVR